MAPVLLETGAVEVTLVAAVILPALKAPGSDRIGVEASRAAPTQQASTHRQDRHSDLLSAEERAALVNAWLEDTATEQQDYVSEKDDRGANPSHNWYAVTKGTKVGIFKNWINCKPHVNRVRGSVYQGFSTRAEAKRAYDDAYIAGDVEVVLP
ncbi:hypothetical protein EUX98_g8913 [Antrodiella citrinella]|uniref:Ribonuclease H1 N-terminal domain-containing protein n=1 Tax=Antrodiella citrinella TaxID=2447956 RepID=A0A4S4M0Z0_9APHY|nr:hypothetical protein EUX98_g8913 [Antrodiella citrinella]